LEADRGDQVCYGAPPPIVRKPRSVGAAERMSYAVAGRDCTCLSQRSWNQIEFKVDDRGWEPTDTDAGVIQSAAAGNYLQSSCCQDWQNIRRNSRRDGGIRTRDLLLPKQLHPAARRRQASPNVPFTCDNDRLMSLDVARCLCMLAPTLTPHFAPIESAERGVIRPNACSNTSLLSA
jgi:hypothetical protein